MIEYQARQTNNQKDRESLLVSRPSSRVTRHASRVTYHSGFSLIEVLVAALILLVGIYGVVKVFPAGFAAIESSRIRSVATRLAQNQMESWKNNSYRLPDAVIDSSGDVNTSSDVINESNGITAQDKLKRVLGERIKMSAPLPLGNSPTYCFALLASGAVNPSLSGVDRLRVYREVIYTKSSSVSPTGSTEYHLKGCQNDAQGSGLYIYFKAATYDRVFRIDCTWLDNRNVSHFVYGERVTLAANATQVNLSEYNGLNPASPTPYTIFQAAICDSERVVEEQEITLPNTANDQNDHSIGTINLDKSYAGAILKVDYSVVDWHWITEEKTADANGVVNLSVGFVSDVYPVISSAFVVNRATGVRSSFNLNALTNAQKQQGSLSFGAGMANQTLRIAYKTLDKWGVQFFKAVDAYREADIDSTIELNRQFADNSTSVTTDNTSLGFKASEAGKMVSIDYVVPTITDNTDPDYAFSDQTIRGELHSVPLDPDSTPVVDTNFLYEVELNHKYYQILKVQGVDFRVRVFWNEANRNKKVDLITYLTRAAS